MPLATEAHLEIAVSKAATAYATWKDTPDAERADACRRIASVIETNAHELARLLTLEQGKPLGGLGSRFEVGAAVAWARHAAEIALLVEVLQDNAEGRVELPRSTCACIVTRAVNDVSEADVRDFAICASNSARRRESVGVVQNLFRAAVLH